MHKPANSHKNSLMEMICHGFMWRRKLYSDEKEQHVTKKQNSSFNTPPCTSWNFGNYWENTPVLGVSPNGQQALAATRLATWGHHWPAPKLQFYHLSGTRDPVVETKIFRIHLYTPASTPTQMEIWIHRFLFLQLRVSLDSKNWIFYRGWQWPQSW